MNKQRQYGYTLANKRVNNLYGIDNRIMVAYGNEYNRIMVNLGLSCMGKRVRNYSTYANLYQSWERLQDCISSVNYKTVFPGSIYASTRFNQNAISAMDFDVLTLAFIQLIEQYASNMSTHYVKVTIGFKVKLKNNLEFSYTLGKAIPLYDTLGIKVNRGAVYDEIDKRVREQGEVYQDSMIIEVFIRTYYEPKDSILMKPIDPQILFKLIVNVMESKTEGEDLPDTKSLHKIESRISDKLNRIKRSSHQCRSFIVADIETILLENIHTPYAAGFLVMNPGDDLNKISNHSIRTYFSEDHIFLLNTFEERSHKMLFDFLYNMELYVLKNKSQRLRTVYFHNFSRFDGIFLLKYYSERSEKYQMKTLYRNNVLYELKVYIGGRLLFRFRDSLTLLPGSLDSLGQNLCPELGGKESIPHDELNEYNIKDFRERILSYLEKDILLLGGVVLKTQQINWEKYKIDIEDVLTLSSLSLKIFRMHYLNDKEFIISIPTKNQDTFIRRGYYGGHVDVYKPNGENLYYYDVNSLYPFVMKEFPMPCGKPTWNNQLMDVPLENLFGFIEAYVECPSHIKKPFLPFKRKDGTLIYPSGKFTGVYYSEELKYAQQLGYTILPLRGYLFDMKPSPFKGFVSDLYERRLDAKKTGDQAMSFVYKILMNSLYGRFGINPESTVTEMCNQKRYEELMKKDSFLSAEKLNDHYYVVNYVTNRINTEEDEWKPPNMSAVHIAAAVTACARIHMYPFISREDCYYTDTDSVILGNPLTDAEISSTELGMFKLEEIVKMGIFLAPKSYMLAIDGEKTIMKHKGIGKELVTSQWFEKVLEDPSYSEEKTIKANFRIDYKKIQILSKDVVVRLAQPKSNKRINVYDEKNVWIDTKPIELIDIGSSDSNTILKFLLQKTDKTNNNQTNTTIFEQPILYKTKAEAMKAKRDLQKKNLNKPKPDE